MRATAIILNRDNKGRNKSSKKGADETTSERKAAEKDRWAEARHIRHHIHDEVSASHPRRTVHQLGRLTS